jgi:hypothetical protein
MPAMASTRSANSEFFLHFGEDRIIRRWRLHFPDGCEIHLLFVTLEDDGEKFLHLGRRKIQFLEEWVIGAFELRLHGRNLQVLEMRVVEQRLTECGHRRRRQFPGCSWPGFRSVRAEILQLFSKRQLSRASLRNPLLGLA